MTFTSRDLDYMALALRLAGKGRGTASPNPMVGALVVSGGRIVGQGYHRRPGEPHAEILALRQAGHKARGATLYVTLEPCRHLAKRTPPCVPAVIESGIRRVVIAAPDPNPLVRGKGVHDLRRARLAVTVGVLRAEAEALNRAYAHWITTGRPYVTLKAGMTLDGQIATASGESQWITGIHARRDAHRLRQTVDAILVGAGTVVRDDPELTARAGPSLSRPARRQPLRVVVDSRLRIPIRARVCRNTGTIRTLLATTSRSSGSRRRVFERMGVEVVVLPAAGEGVSMKALFALLGKRGVTSVLLEGGSTLNASALRGRFVNRVRLYVAPVLLGGQDAKGVIGGASPSRLTGAVPLREVRVDRLGADLLIEAEL